MKSKKICRMVLRSVLICMLVTTININIAANKVTFSMFTSSANGYSTIKTADTGDLIKDFRIIEEFGQQFIVIEPGEFLKDKSIVYFEVTGDAQAYIMHINQIEILKDKDPINDRYIQWSSSSMKLKMSKNKQYFISSNGAIYIPIFVNINMWQKTSVLMNNGYKGNITLRYLNGFINETESVTLSSAYLNSRWLCGTDYYFWENAKSYLTTNKHQNDPKPNLTNEFESSFNNKFQDEFKKLFKDTLDNDQIEVIDAIAFGYREYVSNLEIKNKELLKQLEALQKEKEKLTSQIEDLNKGNITLSEELSSQIKDLKDENEELQAIIDELRRNNKSTPITPINPVGDNKIDKVNIGEVGTVVISEVNTEDINMPSKEVTTPAISNETGNEDYEENKE